MDLQDLDYTYPPEAVAQRPARSREQARLLHVPRAGPLAHEIVTTLGRHFAAGDVLVLNDSRVLPARLLGVKETGGRVEVLLLEERATDPPGWLAVVGSSRAPRAGALLRLAGGLVLRVVGRERELFILRAEGSAAPNDVLAGGRPPLPPYIHREPDADDAARYQTTYARRDGAPLGTAGASSAAPTAGLHLTEVFLSALAAAGVIIVRVTLGIGTGTFRPVEARRVEDHRMHEEPFEVQATAADAVNAALREGRRVTAVGTTALRALEAAATARGRVRVVTARTGLFLAPGSPFHVVTRLLTNFHQPRTTLLALVQAFGGRDRVMAAYAEAIGSGYRLFSYGDAMLLERAA